MYRPLRFRQRNHAFTLVELLVVVAIIVVLIAVLLPSLGRAREAARTAKCGAELRQWGIAAYTYASNNNGILPAKGGDGCRTPLPGQTTADAEIGDWNSSALWFNALPTMFNSAQQGYSDLQNQDRSANGKFSGNLPHAGVNSIFICPSVTSSPQGVMSNAQPPGSSNADTMWDGGSASTAGGTFFMVYGHNDTTNPSPGTDGRPFLICYQWNSKLSTRDPSASNYLNVDTSDVNDACPRLNTIQKSQNLIMMSEKRVRQDELKPNDPENPCVQIDPSYYNYYYYPLCQSKGDWNRFTTRHLDGGNILFIDGRVEYAKYRDVVTPSVLPAGANNNIADFNQPGKFVWNPLYPAN